MPTTCFAQCVRRRPDGAVIKDGLLYFGRFVGTRLIDQNDFDAIDAIDALNDEKDEESTFDPDWPRFQLDSITDAQSLVYFS